MIKMKIVFDLDAGGLSAPIEKLDLSFFKNHRSEAPTPMPLAELVRRTREDEWLRELTEKCRGLYARYEGLKAAAEASASADPDGPEAARLKAEAAAAKHAYDSQKAQAGGFTPAAAFDGPRRVKLARGLTGLSLADFDGLDSGQLARLTAAAREDEHTLFLARSASGRGVHVLFRYVVPQGAEPDYREAWQTGNEYYRMITGLDYDPSCSDCARLLYLSHDAEAYFNPGAKAFSVVLASAVKAAPGSGWEADPWQFALDLSERAGHRWAEGQRHRMALDLARVANKLGLTAADCSQGLASLTPALPEREAEQAVRWAYERFAAEHGSLRWQRTARGWKASAPAGAKTAAAAEGKVRTARLEDIEGWLRGHAVLRHNEVSGKVEVSLDGGREFQPSRDALEAELLMRCDRELGMRVRRSDFQTVLTSSSVAEPYDPLRAYFEALPQWDGTDHIGRLAASVHTAHDPAFFAEGLTKWLVGLAAAVMSPGEVVNQIILALVGPQGTYKSTFFRMLVPPELKDYYLVKADSSRLDKDARIALCGNLLINLEEIDTLTPRETSIFKALVTAAHIQERAPYARNAENRAHRASFCATGNQMRFLTDDTGNRRWLPFQVERIDSPYAHPGLYFHAGLYAQALALLRQGYRYWIDKGEQRFEQHIEQFVEENLEEEALRAHFVPPVVARTGGVRQAQSPYSAHNLPVTLSLTQIFAEINAGGLRGQVSKRRTGQALKKLGFPVSRRASGNVYTVCRLCNENMQQFAEQEAQRILLERDRNAPDAPATDGPDPSAR